MTALALLFLMPLVPDVHRSVINLQSGVAAYAISRILVAGRVRLYLFCAPVAGITGVVPSAVYFLMLPKRRYPFFNKSSVAGKAVSSTVRAVEELRGMEVLRDSSHDNSGIFPEPARIVAKKRLIFLYFLDVRGKGDHLFQDNHVLRLCLDHL